MAIQMRQGNEVDFDAEKMLPGEWAVSTDAKIVRICFAPGIVARMATYEAFEADMVKIEAILKNVQDIQTAIKLVQAEINGKSELVAENASLAEEYMLKAKEYAEQAGAFTGMQIAKRDLLGVVKGGDMAVEDDGALRNFKSGAGNTFTVSDTVESPFSAYKLYGKSVQETVPGNQLLDTGDYELGTYSIETGEENSSSDLYRFKKAVSVNAGETIYFLKPLVISWYSGTEDNLTFMASDTNANLTKTVPDGVTYAKFRIFMADFATFNPSNYMVSRSEITAWEPYVGGIPSPNPSFPQPIVSVGEKLAMGNQLIEPKLESGEINGVTITRNDDGSYTLNGTATAKAVFRIDQSTASVTDNLKGYDGTYTISLEGNTNSNVYASLTQIDTWMQYLNTTSLADSSDTFTAENCYVAVVVASGATLSNYVVKPMLNAGSTALSWEPYTGGKKAAYDVGIGNDICGKNLLKVTAESQTINGVTFTVNDDGSVTANGTASARAQFLVGTVELSAGTYIVSQGFTSTTINQAATSFLRYIINGVAQYVDVTGKSEIEFTLDTNCTMKFMAEIRTAGAVVSNAVFKPMIRLASVEDDTYVPYVEPQNHTLNRTLRAIPVTDPTLANYTDESGQMWCADTIEEVGGKMCLVERVSHFEINGARSLDSQGKIFATNYPSDIAYLKYGASALVLCDSYVALSLETARAVDYGITQYMNALYIANKDWNYDVDTANSALAENPIGVDYILATPIITELTAEEVSALESLHSYDGVTTVMSDAWAEVECATSNVAALAMYIKRDYVPKAKYDALESRISALEQQIVNA